MRGWTPKDRGYESPEVGWRFVECEAAKFWGMTPWEFDARPRGEKAEMVAFMHVSRQVESFQYESAERAAGVKP